MEARARATEVSVPGDLATFAAHAGAAHTLASTVASLATTTSSTSALRPPRCLFTSADASLSRWWCDRCEQMTCAASLPAAAPSACELTVPGVLNPLPPALGPPPGVDTPLSPRVLGFTPAPATRTVAIQRAPAASSAAHSSPSSFIDGRLLTEELSHAKETRPATASGRDAMADLPRGSPARRNRTPAAAPRVAREDAGDSARVSVMSRRYGTSVSAGRPSGSAAAMAASAFAA